MHLDSLLQKPLKAKDFDLYCLMAVGLYQLKFSRIPAHAAVSETVNTVSTLAKPWARKLVNAVLRNYQRTDEHAQQSFQNDERYRYSHPDWMIKILKQDWPSHWRSIADENNKQAQLTLRVNRQLTTIDQAVRQLKESGVESQPTRSSPDGLIIDSGIKIWNTPAFKQAKISVQDESAQLVAHAVALSPAMKVLDACAAPGGKTAHLLELEPDIKLTALEIQASRIQRMQENLARLKLDCEIVNADAGDLESWWNQQLYDLIIIDAPCSGSGVIRKHPDIKHLRREKDIDQNVETQRQLLDKLWSVLKVGGKMLYCTCSVFRRENDHQAAWLLSQKVDARHIELPGEYGLKLNHGRQRFPGDDGSDGFYYVCFEKRID